MIWIIAILALPVLAVLAFDTFCTRHLHTLKPLSKPGK